MNRLLACLWALALVLLIQATVPDTAQAWFPHGTPTSPTVPVMQNVADNFGNLTPNGRGKVRLSSIDLNYGTALNPSGLDLITNGIIPAKWTVTCTGGTCSHWTLPAAHTAEGASAITPVPSAAGATAHLNGGPYTFLVQAEDSSNNVLASSTLTRTIDTGGACGAVNYGTGDPTFSNWPGGFASTTGCKFMFSTGFVSTGRLAFTMQFGNVVTVTWADTARPGSIIEFETSGASTNVLVKDMTMTGPTVSGVGGAGLVLNGTGAGTLSSDNYHAFLNATIRATGSYSCLGGGNPVGGGSHTNFGCDWTSGGFSVATGYTYSNWYVRHPGGDILTLQNACNFTIQDGIEISSQLPSAVHPDSAQIKDGSSICNYTVKRMIYVQAGGSLDTQGIYFGGGPNFFTGYIDDGSGTGTPGKVLTQVAGQAFQAQSNGSTIYTPGGGSVGLPGAVMNCPAGGPYLSNCNSVHTADLAIASPISLGTPGSPVQFYGMADINGNWDQIVSTGFLLNGFVPSSIHGTSNYTHFAHVYETTAGVTPQSAPLTLVGNCNVPQFWTGTFSLAKGMEYAGTVTRQQLPSSSQCPGNALPASITQSNVLAANNNTATLASYYVNGDPKAYLDALSSAQWDALTPDQVKARVCQALTPKAAGPLDLGGGDWANPFNASGQWVDGTAVTGC